MKKVLLAIGSTFAALLVLVCGAALWLLNTERGASLITTLAVRQLGERLTVGEVAGTLAGPLTLSKVRWRDPRSGMHVAVGRATVDIELLALLRREVRVRNAAVHDAHIQLGEPQPEEPPEEPEKPLSLEAPIDIVVERFAASRVVVERDAGQVTEGRKARLVTIREADFVGRWTRNDIAVERLDVRAAEGTAQLRAAFATSKPWIGTGQGDIRWRVGGSTYAARLAATSTAQQARLELDMSSPLTARLAATLEQSAALPWQFTLELPRFDPRRELMPDGPITAFAASLRGAGTLDAGTVSGEITLDDIPMQIDPLRFTRDDRRVTLDPLRIRLGEHGSMEARGEVLLAAEPLQARLDLNWRDIELPERWVGQTLQTRGNLEVSGSVEAFASRGRLAIGPPGRLVDIALDVDGTPAALEVREIALLQEKGRFVAQGRLDLEPRIAWDLTAQAEQFDPGALLVGWPGDLSFALGTRGTMPPPGSDAGPQASLELHRLRGRLRNREVAGSADLTLTPARIVSGTLNLRSGASRVSLRGARGERMSAVATFEVPDLVDWLPDASGSASGRITAEGVWPRLQIAARARGRDLRMADATLGAFSLVARLSAPERPAGSVRLTVQDAAAAGLQFRRLSLRASGDEDAHQVELTASGEPLSGDLRISGGRRAAGWSGTIERLALDMPKAASLALEQPAEVAFGERGFSLERTCLVGTDVRTPMQLCAALDSRPDGSLDAQYSLQRVQLGMLHALVPGLPVIVEGTLEGAGNVQRTRDGTLAGTAEIRSPRGRIAPAEVEDEALLTYTDLRLAADFAGSEATATFAARLDDEGELHASLALAGIGETHTTLDAQSRAVLPSLAPLMLLAPQLAELEGRVELDARAGGTLQAPQISGEMRVADLATQVPALGLEIENGRLRASTRDGGTFVLDGELRSGDGRLTLEGEANDAGQVRVRARGQDVLAADIPAAYVVVNPDLVFTRDAQRMSLTGEVVVPRANIDVSKLPQSAGQNVSSDVVVVDDDHAEQPAAALPLEAQVTVVLGKQVQLVGFGLEAQLGGRLRVQESPGKPTTGSGEIEVNGTYQAYGQDLTVERGQLLFAGTPLDNPRLSITAFREVDDVRVGLQIGGTGRAPQISLFSDPAMSQSEALSYIVAGRPLNQIGNGDGDGDALQSAARSLGTAGGGLLARSIGNRLGVDEVGVEEDEMIGGAAFTVGQYLSPRLYVSYGVGLFEPGEVISLRYRLTDSVSVEAARGSSEMRAGIEYRVER